MSRISSKGGAGMIGTIRSPMAAPSHGLVGRSKLKPTIRGASSKKSTEATVIRSPQPIGQIVGGR